MALVPYAVAYMRNKCLGIPAMVLFFAIIGSYRGYRDLTTPLIGNFLSSVCKVVLGYTFLFQYGMGVAGAGLADALARYCSCLVLLALLVRDGRLRLPDLARIPGKKLVLDLVAPGGIGSEINDMYWE
jgi:Na+-driven multidrug efflux pump